MKEILLSDIGNQVICDLCNADWTDRPESGGFVMGSYGVCPDCAPGMFEKLTKENEIGYIKAICPANKSHAQWIVEDCRRDGRTVLRTYDSDEEMIADLHRGKS